MRNPPHDRIAHRLKVLREEQGMTQEAMARAMGLPHRQTLTSIEAGSRQIGPEELVRAAQALDVELERFTDPFRLVGEGRFFFRAQGVPEQVLDAFEERAGRWIGMYRTLALRTSEPPSRLAHKLELTPRSSFEDAQAAASDLRRSWRLGDVPARTLPEAIERELGALVLFVDAPQGVSGAAVQLPGHNTILVNRQESVGRRNFDLAHELFHVLTWDAMAPDRVEPREVPTGKGHRVEKLAENFAAALLMPAEAVTSRWEARGNMDVYDWLNLSATRLRVSSVALKWRLTTLGHLRSSEANALDDRRLAANGGLLEDETPLPFNRRFVGQAHEAVETGLVSLRKLTRILEMSEHAFGELCGAYGLRLSYDV